MKYTKHLISAIIIFSPLYLFAQNVGIGTTVPDSSAMLDISSNSKGILIPRMTSGQRAMISNPATGLLVFDTSTGSFWFYDATVWLDLSSSTPADLIADADNDTKIQVEKSANEDVIRFDQSGTEYFNMTNGRLNVNNTGKSVFIGGQAGANDDLSANKNIFIGQNAGVANTTGQSNVSIGSDALVSHIIGNYTTAVGAEAMNKNLADSSSAYGYRALYSNTNGLSNTGIGFETLRNNISGNHNVGIGTQAGYRNILGSYNTCVGSLAGMGAGPHNKSNSVYVGYKAGYTNHGSGNVFIGNQAGENTAGSDQLIIENSNTATPLIYGDFSKDLVKINGELEVTGDTKGILPIGTIVLYTGSSAPSGWLICNGSTYNTSLYSDLNAHLGGANTLPDFSGRFPLGKGNSGTTGSTNHALNSDGGEEKHTLSISEMPAHTHNVTITYREGQEQGSSNNYSDLGGDSNSSSTYTSASKGGGAGHNNLPPFLTVNFIIKAR